MKTFRFRLSGGMDAGNPPLRELDAMLSKIGATARIEETGIARMLVIKIGGDVRPTGRPRPHAAEDITIAQMLNARRLNVPMSELAERVGVSVRTLYRRWDAAVGRGLDPDTPYIRWP